MINENTTPSSNDNSSQGRSEIKESEINPNNSIGDFANIQNKGYKPIENTANPKPPQETGTGSSQK